MSQLTITIANVRAAQAVIAQHVTSDPLIRSYALEHALGLSERRRVWIKDYGWTPVGSFKLLGALNWMANNLPRIGDRPVAAHSSGNFAAGISFAAMRYRKRLIVVMPDTAPKLKFDLARSFGGEIRTCNIGRDHDGRSSEWCSQTRWRRGHRRRPERTQRGRASFSRVDRGGLIGPLTRCRPALPHAPWLRRLPFRSRPTG